MPRPFVCLAFFLFFSSLAASAQIAATPPMGWNSWNFFEDKVTDADVRRAADVLVASGMRDAGYIYVNVDDSWEGKRDVSGVIHSNDKFPDMKALGDYLHARGLKFGIYSSPGPQTCAHFEGSYGHEEQDARTYAGWGVDLLKYDLCSFAKAVAIPKYPEEVAAQNRMAREAYAKMSGALKRTGRPIVYSICQYGLDDVWKWAATVGGALWRTTGDIKSNYERVDFVGFGQAGLAKFAGPGHWNDPDMLEIGNGKLTLDENRTHFTLWCMLAAPLIAGNDLSTMKPEIAAILTNREVIAIDQDALGMQADRRWAEGPLELWLRPLKNGDTAVALFNRGDVPLSAVAVASVLRAAGVPAPATARDLWLAKAASVTSDAYKVDLPRHASLLLRLSGVGSYADVHP
jgi:alpha-galactosidase